MTDPGSTPLDRLELARLLGVDTAPRPAALTTLDVVERDGYDQRRVEFASPSGAAVPAFLLVPTGDRDPATAPRPGVVVHHQHAGQRHLGKSEVCGLAGDPFQAFGPALARRGVVVLAPDSICFEDRRPHATGTDEAEPDDTMNHFNAMAYGLLRGEPLLCTVLLDGLAATASLAALDGVDPARVGLLGHSYGGNTTLFQAPLDERVAFACASGAACSFARRMRDGTGIEFASILPGFAARADIGDLLALFAPRPTLVASADADQYAMDATELVDAARPAWPAAGADPDLLQHVRVAGGHALTQERFDAIVAWVVAAAGGA